MKKTLLLFAMLLGVVGAWAQPKVSDAPQDGQWASNTTWYVITLDQHKSILSSTYTDNDNALLVEGQAMTSPGEESLWCVVGDATKGYKFYNKASGTSKILGLTGTDGAARAKMIEEGTNNYVTSFDITPSKIDGHFCMKQPNTNNNYWNNRSKYLAYWNSPDALSGTGSAFLFEEADLEELDIEFTNNTGTIHSGTGKCVKNSNGEFNTRFTIAGIPSEWLTNVTTTDNVYKATIDLPFRLSSDSKSNKFMMGGHGVTNFKIYADNTKVKVQKGKTPTTSDINQFLWEIYPTFEDGIIKFNIKNVHAEAYIYSETPKTEHADSTLSLDQENKSSFILKKIGNDATFAIDGVNLSISSSGSNNVQYVGLNSYTHAGSNMTFIPYWIQYTLTDMAGGVHTGEYEGWSNLQPQLPTFTGAEGYSIGEKTWGNGTVSATIDFKLPVSSETVVNPTFISTYNYSGQRADQFKWYASDNKIKVKEGEEIFSSSIASHLWLIYPKFNNGAFTFQIKNVATGLFINSSVSSDKHDDESTVILSNEATDFTVGKRGSEGAEFINSFEKRLSVNTSKPDPADKIQTVGTYASHYGTAVTFPDYMESTTWPEFVSTGTTLNPLVIAIDNDAKKALVAQKLPSSAERYVRVTGASEEPELGYGQWAIYPAFSGNKIGFKIKNIATETYIYAKPAGASEEYPVVLNAEGTAFDYVDSKFAYTDGGNTLYLSVPTNESFNLPLGVSTEADDTRKTIAFPEFNSFQVTIGEVGYTTLYSPITVVAIPEEGKEVDIYAITDATTSENNKVTLTKLESWDVIPANQGCILKGSGKIAFSKTDDSWVIGDWSTNLLRGSFTNTYVQGDAYVLSAPDGVESVGLYKAMLNKNENGEAGTTHFKNNAGKAYLPASALSAEAAESRFFLFGFGDGEETGITETENGLVKTENTEVYDLAGRRVQGAQKGIFIVNGKKVVR